MRCDERVEQRHGLGQQQARAIAILNPLTLINNDPGALFDPQLSSDEAILKEASLNCPIDLLPSQVRPRHSCGTFAVAFRSGSERSSPGSRSRSLRCLWEPGPAPMGAKLKVSSFRSCRLPPSVSDRHGRP